MSCRIERLAHPSPEEVHELSAALSRFNRTQIPDKGHLPIHLKLIDEADRFAGGLSGYVSYGWLFIETLWIAESLRSQGWGRRLMRAAEEIAMAHGCRHAWLDTFSFQARGFYEKLGYRVFAELENFPAGHSRYFLRKDF